LTLFRILALVAVWFVAAVPAVAAGQVQAIDGVVEGVVRDPTNALVPGASVRVTNLETGLSRQTVTGASGRFQILLVPPGRYELACSAGGFKIARRTGFVVHAGAVVVIDLALETGSTIETVTVIADLPGTKPGKIDAGRTVTSDELVALPVVLRNTLNLALLAPGVTGNEADEINQPRLNANGAQMRNSYQIDGNSNTERDRAGLRLLPIPALFAHELAITTSGFAPEFGHASGVVVNVITPSGTNTWRGSVRGDLSLPSFLARPHLLPDGAPAPSTRAAVVLGSVGGPIIRDRLHVYLGYQRIRRDSSSALITVLPDNATRLGLELPPGLILDEGQTEHFALGKIDYQIHPAHRASFRVAMTSNDSPLAGVAGLTTPDRAVDVFARIGSAATQMTSVVKGSAVNEFRAQYSSRAISRRPSSVTAPAPAIDISGIASFGGPYAAVQSGNSDYREATWQVIDNYAWQAGRHTVKAGVDAQRIIDARVNTPRRIYTFSSIASYLAASSGADRFAYSRYLEDVGDPRINYATTFISAFVQDEAQIGPRIKAVYGVRYDVFGTPSLAGGGGPAFQVDRNNVAPRIGGVWSIDASARTVVRASVGRVFDPPPLSLYEDALLYGKSGRVRTVLVRPRSAGSPLFPDVAGAFNQPPSVIDVDDGFETQSSWLTHVEMERALGSRTTVAVAYARTVGSHLPVLMDENLIPTSAMLADGRPIYSPVVSAATRVDPAYDHIDVVQSIARARYDAVIVTVRTRWRSGIALEASYTGARARDNGPLTNVYVQGSQDDRASDPSDLERDYGPTPFDQPQSFSLSAVATPADWFSAPASATMTAILKNTTVGAIVHADSGMPANLRSNLDLNGDGQSNDRPLDVSRNAGGLGRVFYTDLRIERTFSTWGSGDLALNVSIKNLFNNRNIQQVNRVIPTNAAGQPLDPIPATLPPLSTYDPRRVEIGLRLRF